LLTPIPFPPLIAFPVVALLVPSSVSDLLVALLLVLAGPGMWRSAPLVPQATVDAIRTKVPATCKVTDPSGRPGGATMCWTPL